MCVFVSLRLCVGCATMCAMRAYELHTEFTGGGQGGGEARCRCAGPIRITLRLCDLTLAASTSKRGEPPTTSARDIFTEAYRKLLVVLYQAMAWRSYR